MSFKNPKQFYATFFSPKQSRKDIFGLTSLLLHLSGLGVRSLVKKESAFSELMGCSRGSLKKHLALIIAVPL